MRSILNISLPSSLADSVREEVKNGEYASVSEFVRELIREWKEDKILRELNKSHEDVLAGKYVKLKSLRDLR